MGHEVHPSGEVGRRNVGHTPAGRGSGFWWSRTGLVTVAFLTIGAFFLVSEHRAHLIPWLPWLILLACPLLHVFMHGGHGGDGSSGSSNDRKVDHTGTDTEHPGSPT